MLLVACFVLAGLSWEYVDTPFRRRVVLPDRSRLFALTGVSLATLLGVGLVIPQFDGLPYRFSSAALRYADGETDMEQPHEVTLASALREDFIDLAPGNDSSSIE